MQLCILICDSFIHCKMNGITLYKGTRDTTLYVYRLKEKCKGV